MAEIQVHGLAELKRKFESLPRDISKKLLRKALGASSRQAKLAAVAAAPISARPVRRGKGRVTPPGTLKRSAIVFFDRKQSNDTQAVYAVTFRMGKKQQKANRDAFYARWVEFGHRVVPRKPTGAFWKRKKGAVSRFSLAGRRAAAKGEVAGRKFLTNSFAAGVHGFAATFERVARENFDAAVR